MKKFLILAFLILFVFLAGCTDTTPPAEPVAPQTQVQTPVVTATPETMAPPPFPDALPLKSLTHIGDDANTREISVYKYLIRNEYQFYSADWGRWQPVQAPEGKEFLIIFVRVTHTGTVKESAAPYPSVITVHNGGNSYSYKSGRDPEIPINDVRELEYTGGKLYVHETKEGFLIFEVPDGIRPDETYVSIFIPDGDAPVWKLA